MTDEPSNLTPRDPQGRQRVSGPQVDIMEMGFFHPDHRGARKPVLSALRLGWRPTGEQA